jgi:transposase
MRDRRAAARYAGLTGSPDESGAQRREQGLARAGNARVPHGSSPWAEGPRGMIQLAWRFLMFQKESALALWYRARTADSRKGTRKTLMDQHISRLDTNPDDAGQQPNHGVRPGLRPLL